ncbi:undecaprenyl-diphosphate phosphatase [Scytonema sp. UIC 10036]|uniref:undecaprenyl-diphosphate phosphatase n=1 Tax=Scytonema sp. UIC 10036 TaxID=2304196 RepID=UPI0012DAE648|nr:undecaprenyl-diphosphate phosphatase [Scytonema sp. UIC 10036]MUG95044.1 undecaprenyl-diphosphate phosphatase [Scytonema sp. UIC 10036]
MNFLGLNLYLSVGLGWTGGVNAWSTLLVAADAQTANATSNVGLLQSLFQAIVLGLVQGVTELLPISSTAHLLVFTKVFGWTTFGEKYFVDAIQFGSVIALLLYFRTLIYQTLSGGWEALRQRAWEREEWKLIVGIAVGTVPSLVVGFLLKDVLPESPAMIAILSIVMALLLGLAEKIGSRKRSFDSLQIKDGILVGLGQMLALFPGVSRSGSTLTMALFLGLERQTAARFSFLLGLPTLTIATLYQSRKVFGNIDLLLPLLVGIISTFIFSYLSVAWLLRYLQRQNTWIFVWYRLAFGVSILTALASGWLKNN